MDAASRCIILNVKKVKNIARTIADEKYVKHALYYFMLLLMLSFLCAARRRLNCRINTTEETFMSNIKREH